MTTSNKIITSLVDDARFIPLECLHSQFDTITYVYKREGLNIVKQEVMLGETNANEAVILGGLEEGDRVYLSLPPGQSDKEIRLLPEMNGKRKKKEAEKQPEPEMRPASHRRQGNAAPPTR